MKYQVGQKVKFKKGSCFDFDAAFGTITKIEHDPKGEYGSYLIENDNPMILGWFNESQFEPFIDNNLLPKGVGE